MQNPNLIAVSKAYLSHSLQKNWRRKTENRNRRGGEKPLEEKEGKKRDFHSRIKRFENEKTVLE